MRHRAGRVLEVEAVGPERADRGGDPPRDGLGRSDVEGSARRLGVEVGTGRRRPAALPADAVAARLEVRPELVARPLVGLGDVPRGVDPERHRRALAGFEAELPGELDEAAQRSEWSNLLILDGEAHSRLRRLAMSRFSVKQVRGRREWIAEMVAQELAQLKAKGTPADIWLDYARPIAARTHCRVIGVPDAEYDEFVRLFVENSTAQEKYDFIRRVLEMRENDPGEDIISDLLASDAISREETEGLLRLLMGAGRDSVAYLIATATVALLSNPEQLEILRTQPELFDTVIEEFMRVGAMFVTLFPRTALEDVEIEGVLIKAGQSVSVSPVAANRDPERWDRPEELDVSRDAFGHLGFGHGIHGCIGQQLARVEIREGIRQLIEGCPGLRLVDAEQLKPMPFAHPVAVYEAGSVIVEWD